MAETKTPLNMTSYHSKLVGVTFEGRQDVIAKLKGDEQIRFRREPENEHDSKAVAVDVLATINESKDALTQEWLPIGYIARDKNSELARVLSDGREANIRISEITGGNGYSYGVNVYIEYEKERRLTRSPNAKLVTDFFGNEIFYDDVAHEYTNALGEVYLSGSAYASDDDFDGEYWANDAVVRNELDPSAKDRILAMWDTNGNASRSYGTAIHAAIELYGTYHDIADIIDMDKKTGKRKKLDAQTEKNSALSKLPHLKDVAVKFFTPERLAEKAYYEVLVVDHKNKRAGRIDRLVVFEDGSFGIRDMKTNYKLPKRERDGYTKQLSFYGDIVIENGGRLKKGAENIIHHWTGGLWEDIKLEKIDTLTPEYEPVFVIGKSLSRQG